MMAAAAVARALIDGDDAEQLAQLCQTSKAEAIGAIATEIIHDFNNLLTPMITIMDQIQRDCDHTSVRNARRIESAIVCVERAQQLVHRILNFARATPPARTSFRIEARFWSAHCHEACFCSSLFRTLFRQFVPIAAIGRLWCAT